MKKFIFSIFIIVFELEKYRLIKNYEFFQYIIIIR
jgi:hypothetical protein